MRFSGLSSRGDAMATVRGPPRRPLKVVPGLPIRVFQSPVRYRVLPIFAACARTSPTAPNVAIQHAGAPSDGDVTLRLTVYSGDPNSAGSFTLPDEVLSPGGFKQINSILASQGLSLSNGYVRVERVGGSAPYYAYAVINDQANSDGSFILPMPESSLPVAELTVPVIVENNIFESELALTNFGTQSKTLRLSFVASSIQAPGNAAQIAVNLLPGEQRISPSYVQYLKSRGVLGLTSAPPVCHAGAVFITADGGNVAGIFAGARTSALGGGGRYGLFYSAVPRGAAIPCQLLAEWPATGIAENRANLALVNTGDKDTNANVFSIDLYDGSTGLKVNSVSNVTLAALALAAVPEYSVPVRPGRRAGIRSRLTPTSGANSFLAYAVINDGGGPGQRSRGWCLSVGG